MTGLAVLILIDIVRALSSVRDDERFDNIHCTRVWVSAHERYADPVERVRSTCSPALIRTIRPRNGWVNEATGALRRRNRPRAATGQGGNLADPPQCDS